MEFGGNAEASNRHMPENLPKYLVVDGKKIVDYSDNRLLFQAKMSKFAGSSFLKVRICCLSLSLMIANEESLGFGLKQHEEDTRKLYLVF